MYRSTTSQNNYGSLTCPECGSKRWLYRGRTITCQNCGHVLGGSRTGKIPHNKTVGQDGVKYDSKFEGSVADELRLRKLGGDIKDYVPHFKIPLEAYNKHICNYFVDFLVTHIDGHLEYLEVKSKITETPVWRLKWKMLAAKLEKEDKTAEMTVRLQK